MNSWPRLTARAPGSTQTKLFPMLKRLVTTVNCFVFFGETLSPYDVCSLVKSSTNTWAAAGKDAGFTAAALEFPQVVILAGEVLRITPGCLRQ
jgi:hypothetical protein